MSTAPKTGGEHSAQSLLQDEQQAQKCENMRRMEDIVIQIL
jgi:hypothetical protein